MRNLLLVFIFPAYLMSLEVNYIDTIDKKIKIQLGTEYIKEFKKFSQSHSYPKFLTLKDKRESKKVHSKLSLSVLKYEEIFNVLLDIHKETNSFIPALYAYNLTLLSYGTGDNDINNKYGVPFSSLLMKHEFCEGYIWAADIFKDSPETWRDSSVYYKKAKIYCKDKALATKAKIESARIDYLLEQKRSKK